MRLAQESGVELLSLTDHNTFEGFEEEPQCEYDGNYDMELEIEKSVAACNSVSQIEDFVRLDIVGSKDVKGHAPRGDRRVFNKSEGDYLRFYTETDNFQPNDIDWNGEMIITICSLHGSMKHICTPSIDRNSVSIMEFIDISKLPCGEYGFEMKIDLYELLYFDFHIVDVEPSYKQYSKFDGLSLKGVSREDDTLKSGEIGEDGLLQFDSNEFRKLALSFSFSEIFGKELLQCMVAIYSDADIIEFEDSATFDVTDNSKKLQMAGILDYNKKLEDFSLARGYYTLLIEMFGEEVTKVEFNVI